MKKILLMGLTVFILLALAACGGNDDADTTMPGTQGPEGATTDTAQGLQESHTTTPTGNAPMQFEDYYTFGDVLTINVGGGSRMGSCFF